MYADVDRSFSAWERAWANEVGTETFMFFSNVMYNTCLGLGSFEDFPDIGDLVR